MSRNNAFDILIGILFMVFLPIFLLIGIVSLILASFIKNIRARSNESLKQPEVE